MKSSAGTRKQSIAEARHQLDELEKAGITDVRVSQTKARQRKKKAQPRYITEAEYERILQAADNERDRLFLQLLWQSGGRVSEVCQLRRRDIDVSTTPPTITLINLKQGAYAEKVPGIASSLAQSLLDYCHQRNLIDDDYVFQSQRSKTPKPIGRKMAYRIVTRITSKLGIRKPHTNGTSVPAWPHCFRHGCAVNLLRKTRDLPVVQQQLGHTDIQSTGVYLGITNEDRLNALKDVYK